MLYPVKAFVKALSIWISMLDVVDTLGGFSYGDAVDVGLFGVAVLWVS